MSLPTIPSPPTDNLYKFMAIAGLVLFVIAPAYLATFHLADKQRQFDAEMAELRELPPPQYNGVRARILSGDTNVTVAEKEMVQKYDAIDMERVRAERIVELHRSYRSILAKATLSITALGFVMMVIGFCLWYRRVQIPLDRILKQQVAAAENKAALSQEVDKPMD